jgi:hypothetical protein
VQLAQALRRLTDHDLEETASTRLLVMAARLVALGLPLATPAAPRCVDALTDDADTAAALAEVQEVQRAVTRPSTDPQPHGGHIGAAAPHDGGTACSCRAPCTPCSVRRASFSWASSPCSWPRPRWTCCASTCTSAAVGAGPPWTLGIDAFLAGPGHAPPMRRWASCCAASCRRCCWWPRLPGRGLALRPAVLRLAVPALLAGGTAQRPAAPRQRRLQPVGPPSATPIGGRQPQRRWWPVFGRPALAFGFLWASRC